MSGKSKKKAASLGKQLPENDINADQHVSPCEEDKDPYLLAKVYYENTSGKSYINAQVSANNLTQKTKGRKAPIADFKYVPVGKYTVKTDQIRGSIQKKYDFDVEHAQEIINLGKNDKKTVELRVKRLAQLKVIVKRSDKKNNFLRNVTIVLSPGDNQDFTQQTSRKGVVKFEKLKQGNYEVKAKLTPEDKEKYKFDSSDTQPWELHPDKTNEVTFKLTPIIRIYLKLQFKDPEGKNRTFPKGFEFKMNFEAGPAPRSISVRVKDDGTVTHDGRDYVEVPRVAKSFKLELTQSTAKSVVCEKRGGEQKQELVSEVDPTAGTLLKKLKAEGRMFCLPIGEWTLKNSKWEIKKDVIRKAKFDSKKYEFRGLDNLDAEVGSKGSPVEVTLQPVWQFIRFVYYDRKLKGNDLLSLPSKPNAEILPVHVEAWRLKTDETGGKVPDSICLWHIGGDEKTTVQCLPWIIGKDNKNAPDKIKPDADTILRFKRKEVPSFVKTSDTGERKLIEFANVNNRDKPSAGRLSYYDLPAIWKSRGYFGWLSDTDGEYGPYEDIAAKDTTKDKPITFSLDDMVLTKDDLSPVATTNATRIALLANTFATSGAKPANTGPSAQPAGGKPQKPTPAGRRWLDYQGLYNPDLGTPHHLSFFSKVKMEVNYIADYPNWTRMVAVEGNLFDVFDQRTPDHASNIVGARAAVRWVDAVTGKPANSSFARPARTDKNFFSVQPYYEQEYPQRFAQVPYNHSAPTTCKLGRFDYALLRCCDVDGADEKSVCLIYFRMNFEFDPPGTAEDVAKYGDKFVTNVAKRYNGADGTAPGARTEFLPQVAPVPPAKPVKMEVVWFGQSLPVPQSQFKCKVVTAGGRSWFNAGQGTGELSPTGNVGSGTTNGFVGAHECGHGVSLNDEYCERWNAQSYGQLSFRWHLPGDPYEPDGRTVEFQVLGSAMMNGNQQMRNRYLWHIAEWVRATTTIPMKVKIGTYDDYKLPPHPTSDRTYAFWPIEATSDYEPDAVNNRGKMSILLYALGKDRYTVDILPGGTFDGILIVTVNITCTFPVWGAAAGNEAGRKKLLQDMAANIRTSLNNKFKATGKIQSGTAQEWIFGKCLIHFSPRFVVINHHTENAAAVVLNGAMGSQFAVEAEFTVAPTKPVTRWDPTRAVPDEIMTEADFKNGTGATPGPRNPVDAVLGDLDGKVQAYHAIDDVKLPERIAALKVIVDKSKAWLDTPAVGVPATTAKAARKPSVQSLHDKAVALHAYLTVIKTNRSLKLEGPDFPDIEASFSTHFPSMIGIYKSCSDVTAADLTSIVRKVIPTGVVSDI